MFNKFFISPKVSWRYKALLVGFAALFIGWVLFAIPYGTAFPKDFGYEFDVVSVDNFYDEAAGIYLGEEYSATSFIYNTVESVDGNLVVRNLFDVRTQRGDPIFSVERLYGVDRFSGEHVAGVGDKDRNGYLFAPRWLGKGESFTYWHINYDAPAVMEYVEEAEVFGLETFKYVSRYEESRIDQTENLLYLPRVPEERGVVVEPELTLWVEPISGRIVKYEDTTIAYYYDQDTGEKIAPWNKFQNKLTEQSVREQVILAQDAKVQTLLFAWYIPFLIASMGLLFVVFGPTTIGEYVRRKSGNAMVVPSIAGLVLFLSGFVLIDWAFNTGIVATIFYGNAGMNPLTALTFFTIGLALAALSIKANKAVFVLTGIVMLFPLANLLSLLNVIPIDVDLLLFQDAVQEAQVPSRMSWFTTTNFLLLGLSGLTLQNIPGFLKRGFSFLPFFTLASAVLGILGFIFGSLNLIDLGLFSGVGLNTALLLIAVAFAALHTYGFRIRRTTAILFGVFFSILFITLMINSYVVSSSQQKLDSLFILETSVVENAILERFNIYASTLAGGVGLFDASDFVSRDEWRAYVEAIRIKKNYPGIQGIGYATVVDDEQALIEQVRAEGFPDFSIYPESPQDLRTSIMYLEPFDERNQRAFGYDMYSEQSRRVAMQRARDSGNPRISGKITLLQETAESVQPGFLMYVPVYAGGINNVETIEERKSAIEGFVYSPFRMNDFMQGLGTTGLEDDITFRIFDGVDPDPEALLFERDPEEFEDVRRPEDLSSHIIYVAGHPWFVQYKRLEGFGNVREGSALSVFVLVGGILLSGLTTLVFYALISSRERALAYADRITKSLKVSKDQLLEQKTQTEALLGSLGESVIAVSVTGDIIFINEHAEKFLNVSPKEIQGKSIYEVLSVVDEEGNKIPRGKRSVYQAIKTKKRAVESKSMVQTHVGAPVPVLITASPVLLDGKLVGAVAVIRDVSRERAIDKAKSEFVSLASHQLRTPLSTINWYSEMLLDGDAGKVSKKQREYLDQIYTGNQRMIDLVNALLNVSRIELGTFAVEPEEMNFNDVVKDVLKEIEQTIDLRKLHLTVDCAKLATMVADPRLLRMVVTNLLTNAVKYTPEGGEVKVSTAMVKGGEEVGGRTARGESIFFCVRDTGFGIPKEQHERIFQKLFRADNVRRKDTQGTGLGLYIVKSIIDLAGGKIWFTSEEDAGTTFFVLLPVHGMEKKDGAKRIE